MRVNEYQAKALRTNNEADHERGLINGALGLSGESGECADIVKKHLFQGHELDKKHLAKELGDVAWYLAITAYHIGYNLESIFEMNINKLMERYPDGFNTEKSRNRHEGDV